MKKKLIAVLLTAAALSGLLSCSSGDDIGTIVTAVGPDETQAPAQTTVQTTEAVITGEGFPTAPADTTAAAPVTTAAPAVTAEETDYPLNGVGVLEGNELSEYMTLLPVLLPDGSVLERFTRGMSLDDADFDFYSISGNSLPTFEWVDAAGGALYGHAAKFAAAGKDENNRGEITVQPYYANNPQGAKGIMFWVDMSHVKVKNGATQCASVTINTNTVRSHSGVLGEIKAYYYENDVWVETTNTNACRLILPNGFKGWVYVPASSYYFTNAKDDAGRYTESAADNDGKFKDIDVENMRCYTDGYVYSYDDYIIFDEILFVF